MKKFDRTEFLKLIAEKRYGEAKEYDLIDADLTRADLTRADLRGAVLRGADLIDANLRGAVLIDADLTRANLIGANLRGAVLTDANLRGANLDTSCWPLWCGSLGVIVDKRIACQLAYHLCALICDDAEYIAARNSILDFANQFHRVEECGRLEEV
jgi:uncharacterized protein YjbI with pentapeptide repeats